MLLVVEVMLGSQLGFGRDGEGVVRPLDFLGGLIVVRLGDGGRATRGGRQVDAQGRKGERFATSIIRHVV